MLRFKDIIIASQFFIIYFGLSVWFPFFNLYLKDLGFSGTQVGVIAGCFQGMLFFVVPVWGILSDRKGNRNMLQIALLFTIFILWGFQYVQTFWSIIALILVLGFFHHPLGPLVDTLAIIHIAKVHRFSFGSMRVWGSIGWAIGTVAMGRFLLNRELDLIFPAGALIYFFMLLTTFLIKEKREKSSGNRFAFNALKPVFGQKPILFFLLILFLFGIGVSPLFVFINLYFRDIGASNQIIGFVFALQAISEIPFFFLGHKFVKKFGSKNLLTAVIGFVVLRQLGYSLISNPKIALSLGIAQGLTFSLFWVSVTDLTQKLIPQQWRSTGHSLIWAFNIGGGVTIGNMTIGRLSDSIPMQKVMLLGAVFSLFVGGMTLLYFRKYKQSFI
jgi:MFS transporter, PPP family, 3-phenylpropionic acid transporter